MDNELRFHLRPHEQVLFRELPEKLKRDCIADVEYLESIDDPEFQDARLQIFPLKNSALRAFGREVQKCTDIVSLAKLMQDKGSVLDGVSNEDLFMFLGAVGPDSVDLFVKMMLLDVRTKEDLPAIAHITQLRHGLLEFMSSGMMTSGDGVSPAELFEPVMDGPLTVPENPEGISLDAYMEYMHYHNTIDKEWYVDEKRKKDSLKEAGKIFMESTSLEEKRHLLFLLAHIGELEAIIALEKYCEEPDSALVDWAKFCLDECRMHLESKELGKSGNIILTGAGAKDGRLRYYSVFLPNPHTTLSSSHLHALKTGFSKTAGQFNSVIESFLFLGPFILLSILIPPDQSPDAVLNCGFELAMLHKKGFAKDFLSTNVCKPTEAMVRNWMADEKVH
jgi:hypothetical protein